MIPLFKPYMPDQLPELENILQSGNLSYGKWGKAFEAKLAGFIGKPYVLTANSYNAAFLVAITTLGLQNGDSVIASPMSCLASNQPFATMGIQIIWADIDPVTGTLDPDDVRKKILPGTKAIVLNHFCGYAGDISAIGSIARENGLYLIEDAIEAFGTRIGNHYVGNTGADVTVFSFQTVRLPNTIDGGGLSFRDEVLYTQAEIVRDYGINRSRFRDSMGEINPECDISLPGYGALLPEPNSYIGCMQMDRVPALLQQQSNNAEKYKSEFLGLQGINILKLLPGSTANYWVFGLLTENKKQVMADLRSKGLYASGVHLNNNEYSVFGRQPLLPGVKEFAESFVAIPCGWWINKT